VTHYKAAKDFIKACFAQQAATMKKCIAKIFQGNRSMTAPIYTGMMVQNKKVKKERT
jgi:hypothetical protein